MHTKHQIYVHIRCLMHTFCRFSVNNPHVIVRRFNSEVWVVGPNRRNLFESAMPMSVFALALTIAKVFFKHNPDELRNKKTVEGFLETIDSKMDTLKNGEEWNRTYSLTEASDDIRLIVATVSRQLTLFFIGYRWRSLVRNPPSAQPNPTLIVHAIVFCKKSCNVRFGPITKQRAPARTPGIMPLVKSETNLPFQETFSGEKFFVATGCAGELTFGASACINRHPANRYP